MRPGRHRCVITPSRSMPNRQEYGHKSRSEDGTPLVFQDVVLIGGRPIPERPLWVRFVIVLAAISFAIPLVKFAYAQRAAFGILPRKLTAEQTAAALPARLYWAPPNDPRRDVRCEEHSRTSDSSSGRTGAWDYICTFVPRPEVSQKRLKVGVRVRHDAITDVSTQYELDAGYVK
jgi:hypothetical protein